MTTELAKLELSNDVLDIIKTGDLGRLNDQQQLQYYVYECRRIGLDPASRPFAWIKLNGKLVLYADRRCGDMLSTKHGYSTEILEGPCLKKFGDASVLYCRVKATMQNGRSVEDIGTLPVSDIVNGLMKCLSKAVRRATLRLAGWGGLDESELETIPASAKSPAAPIVVLQQGQPAGRPRLSEEEARHRAPEPNHEDGVSDVMDVPVQDTPALDALREALAPLNDIEFNTTLLNAARVWRKHKDAVYAEAGGDIDSVYEAQKLVLGVTKISCARNQLNEHVAAIEMRSTSKDVVFCDVMDMLELANSAEDVAEIVRKKKPAIDLQSDEARELLRKVAVRRVQELLPSMADTKRAAQWLRNALSPKDPEPPNGGPKPNGTPANDSADPERTAIEQADSMPPAAGASLEERLTAYVASKTNIYQLQNGLEKHFDEFKPSREQLVRIVVPRLVELSANTMFPLTQMGAINACQTIWTNAHQPKPRKKGRAA